MGSSSSKRRNTRKITPIINRRSTRHSFANRKASYQINDELDRERDQKYAEIEKARAAERIKAVDRRERLTKLVEKLQDEIYEEAKKIAEDSEFVENEVELRRNRILPCCSGRYVSRILRRDPYTQIDFIIKALVPTTIIYFIALIIMFSVSLSRDFQHRFYSLAFFPCACLVWIGLNIFGRIMRTPSILFVIIIARGIALFLTLAAFQTFLEYIVWEGWFRYTDTESDNSTIALQMSIRMNQVFYYPESWLELPTVPDLHSFKNRKYFIGDLAGTLIILCWFVSCLSIRIGLSRKRKKEYLTSDEIIGPWIRRIGVLMGILPILIIFIFREIISNITDGRRQTIFDYGQYFIALIFATAFGYLVSSFWKPLFAGNSCYYCLTDPKQKTKSAPIFL